MGIVGAVGGAVVFAAHEGQPCLFAQAGAGAGELHVAAHRVRRAVDDQQQRLVLCFLAEGVSRARDDAQNTQHVARRGEHGDLAARERRVRMAQGCQLCVPLQHLRVAHLQRRAVERVAQALHTGLVPVIYARYARGGKLNQLRKRHKLFRRIKPAFLRHKVRLHLPRYAAPVRRAGKHRKKPYRIVA